MNEINEIFVPVEFSDNSSTSIELAVLFAQKLNARVHLVYSSRSEKKPDDLRELEKLHVYKLRILEKISAYYNRKLSKPVPFNFSMSPENGNRHLFKLAEEQDNSAISVGIADNLGHFNKSNLDNKISLSKKPVFTVYGTILPTSIRNIILPVERSEEVPENLFYALYIAELFKAHVHLLLTNLPSIDRAMRELVISNFSNYFRERNITYTLEEIKGSNSIEQIINYTRIAGGDLIAANSHSHKGLVNYLPGIYNNQLMVKSPVPVMFVPSRKRQSEETGINISTYSEYRS